MLTRNDEMMGARAKSGKASNGNGSWPEHTARIPITYERETLHEQVWAEPLRTVAKSYGVSDVYLGKVCRQLSVPLPGRGYWAKVRAGQSPRRLRLPKLKKDETDKLVIWHQRQAPRKRLKLGEEAKVSVAAPILVAETLTEPHKLVARTERRLSRAKARDGVVSGRRFGLLDVSVSPETLDRALRIFDALIKGIAAAGLQVEVARPAEPSRGEGNREGNDDPDRVTRVLCREEWLTLCLWEEVACEVDPTPKPARRRPGDPFGYAPWQPPTYIYTPTGDLAPQMTNIAGTGVRGPWRDGKRQRLERCLPTFIAQLGVAAEALKAKRAEEEKQRREREEQQRRWQEEYERRLAARERLERLTKEAVAWREASQLRAYAEEGLRRLRLLEAPSEADEARRAELERLLEYADLLDPLEG